MKKTIRVQKEIDVKTLKVKANVRYWEDATINGVPDVDGTLTPCRVGPMWCPIIDVDSGIITNWTKGVNADIHFKVCDEGSYYLLDEQGVEILSLENEYVPNMMAPNGEGYGDYIVMSINEDGKIEGWDISEDSLIEFINDDE